MSGIILSEIKQIAGVPRHLLFLQDESWGEITGQYPELAKLVRQITGKVASRTAARRGGISHDSITRLWEGDRVSEPLLVRFAIGYGKHPNPLLKAAGYPPISLPSASEVSLPDVKEITYQGVVSGMLERLDGLDSDVQEIVLEQWEGDLQAVQRLTSRGRGIIGHNPDGRYSDDQKADDARRVRVMTEADFADDAD